mgnify:CR=1 FL=1
MRILLSNCIIYEEPKLKQTLKKYSNMTPEQITILKKSIADSLKQKNGEEYKIEELLKDE